MTAQDTRIKDLLTAIGTDWKNLWAKIGLGTLTTTSTNLVGAINEVKATADAAVAGTAPDATTSVKGIVELATGAEALALTDGTRAVTPLGLASLRNVSNGLAGLDGTGKVAAAQLPAYVDDVLEYANLAAFPATGVSGVIYVPQDTNKTYRWSGSAYVEISASPGSTDAVTEGTTNLYYTQTRADARVNALVPAATETAAGKAEVATQAETNTGTDDARMVTPLKLASHEATVFGTVDTDYAAYYAAAKA